jgi:long-subunit fatty acid transport protein
MNRIAAASAALLATTALAQAGGLDRNTLGTGFLFESGTYLELGFSTVSPTVSGTLASNGTPSGDIAPSYNFATLSYTQEVTDTLTFGLVVDAPYGADVAYDGVFATTLYPFAGSEAEIRTQQLTAALRAGLTDNLSVYGGLRALRIQGDAYVTAFTNANSEPVTVPTLQGPVTFPEDSFLTGFNYELTAESDWAFGYMVGGAYEIPEIALRVALTYFSEIESTLTGTEGADVIANPIGEGVPGIAPLLGQPVSSGNIGTTRFNVTMPQSVLLEAQSGIAPGTLLFGSVRWTNWDGFDITPNEYPGVSLVDYKNDVWTWSLGVGRRINDDLAVSASLGYEAQLGGFSGNLGPTDGRMSLGIGAEYQITDTVSLAGGVQWSKIGDAQTEGSPEGTVLANFTNNDALAAGIRLGIQF